MVAFFTFWGVLAGVGVVGWVASKIGLPQPKRPDPTAGFPPAVGHALTAITDPVYAGHLWHSLGLANPRVGVPTVHRIASTPVGVGVELVMVLGQSVADWRDRTEDIAAALVVPQVRVTDLGCGNLRLDLVVLDPLADGVAVPAPLAAVDLEAVEAGLTENGGLWLVPVLYRHLLFAGVAGAGKSSAVWAVIAGMAPAIRSGRVELWGIDPKVVELTPGAGLFTRFVTGIDENALVLLHELVAVMADRLAAMADTKSRKHIPTPDEPLIVCWIDEVLALTAFAPEKKFREDADRLIRLLMSQGRAAAISLIVCSQDPSKEIMAWRQMVTLRIGLRMDEPTQTTMVLGQGARDRGARCDEIPPSTPGVAYVGEDGRADFARVRAYYVSDTDIDALVRRYCPQPRGLLPPPGDQADTPDDPTGHAA